MLRKVIFLLVAGAALFAVGACSRAVTPDHGPWDLRQVVAAVRQSVVTVAAMGAEGDVLRIGSGFFIDRDGTLVTNDHVLDGALEAKVKTADGDIFPISTVVGFNPLVDLIIVRAQIPPRRAVPVQLSNEEPNLADRVVVIGSPMGLSQTISEGIVSAVRKHPAFGKVYQLTAPTSPGSSGGPVLDLKGRVIGVVSFQTALGQNINFAVAIKALQLMSYTTGEPSIAEWTLGSDARHTDQAASLCRRGARLSIKGEYKAALDYFLQAAATNPKDPHAWSGLGSCYIGMNQPHEAIEALKRSIEAAPDDAAGHLMLAMYYKDLGKYPRQIDALLQAIRIEPDNLQARMELADAHGHLDQTEAQIEALEQILRRSPDHVPALQRMGQALARIGRYDEALDTLRHAVALAPDNAEIHYAMGSIYHARNLPSEELQSYIQAIRSDPEMVPAHFSIALLFLRQGNPQLALREFAILKSLDKDAAQRLFEMIYPDTIDKGREVKTGK